jgi:hypothetical protein
VEMRLVGRSPYKSEVGWELVDCDVTAVGEMCALRGSLESASRNTCIFSVPELGARPQISELRIYNS